MSGKMYIFPTDILFLSLFLVDDTIEDAPKIQLQNVFEETTATRRRSYTQFAEIKRPICNFSQLQAHHNNAWYGTTSSR